MPKNNVPKEFLKLVNHRVCWRRFSSLFFTSALKTGFVLLRHLGEKLLKTPQFNVNVNMDQTVTTVNEKEKICIPIHMRVLGIKMMGL